VSVAELVHQAAQRHAEPVGYPVPGVQRAARRAVLQVDQHRPRQSGQLSKRVIGQAFLGPQPGQLQPQRLMVRLRSAGHPLRLAVNEP
jgi:hypothetical protein